MHRITSFIQNRPLFLLLLPLFFFLHTLNENFATELFRECFVLIFLFAAIAFALYCLSYLFFRESTKAALFAFILVAFDLFFGSIYDFIWSNFGRIFLLKYTIILPAALIIAALIAFALKRSNKKFYRAILFLNLLFLLFTVWEFVVFAGKSARHQPIYTETIPLQPCDTCTKPDIYLIVADEYAGNQELKDLFSFDNSRFEQELKNRGFHVSYNTFSNYNATVYSMASMLNMGYLKSMNTTDITHKDMFRCQQLIKTNQLTGFLEKMGYSIHNNSFFDIGNEKKLVSIPFFPKKKDMFLAQTLTGHLQKHLGFHFTTDAQIERIKKVHFVNNNIIDSVLVKNSVRQKRGPKFVYTHLSLPHNPYFLDSTGRAVGADSLTDPFKYKKEGYISYLLYANKKFLQLIDTIVTQSAAPPIIILVSDHGFRQFNSPPDKKYYFMTLNAVYLPGGHYNGFYNGMSNVNQFRVILNTRFGQHLPLLKDSSTFLFEPELSL